MKAIAQPSAGIPSMLLPLYLVQVLLRINGWQIKHGVRVINGLNDFFRVYGLRWIERNHNRLSIGQGL